MKIPDEMLSEILKFLTETELVNYLIINKNFNRLIINDTKDIILKKIKGNDIDKLYQCCYLNLPIQFNKLILNNKFNNDIYRFANIISAYKSHNNFCKRLMELGADNYDIILEIATHQNNESLIDFIMQKKSYIYKTIYDCYFIINSVNKPNKYLSDLFEKELTQDDIEKCKMELWITAMNKPYSILDKLFSEFGKTKTNYPYITDIFIANNEIN